MLHVGAVDPRAKCSISGADTEYLRVGTGVNVSKIFFRLLQTRTIYTFIIHNCSLTEIALNNECQFLDLFSSFIPVDILRYSLH